MTTLGESVKGGCGESNGGETANTQRAGGIGDGLPSWVIVGWGAITAIFIGMILRSRRQQQTEQESEHVENPFPEDFQNEKPTSD